MSQSNFFWNQLILFSENAVGLVFKNSLKISNQYGQEIKKINFDFDITRNCFNGSIFYFAVKNVIFLNELENLSNEPVKKISFDEKIQAFAFNKSILIVSLQNNECFFNDFNKNIHNEK
jgi:hypothetical protein